MACDKRCYRSVGQARQATKSASWRILVYWCDECRAHHVSNSHKGGDVRLDDPYGRSYKFSTTRARRAKHSRLPGERR